MWPFCFESKVNLCEHGKSCKWTNVSHVFERVNIFRVPGSPGNSGLGRTFGRNSFDRHFWASSQIPSVQIRDGSPLKRQIRRFQSFCGFGRTSNIIYLLLLVIDIFQSQSSMLPFQEQSCAGEQRKGLTTPKRCSVASQT